MIEDFKLVDIHSHDGRDENNTIKIRSFNYTEEIITSNYFTIGAHPWQLENFNLNEFLASINKYKNSPYFLGIGEIGLDRLKGPPLNRQIEILEGILKEINVLNINVLIFHCVRSYSELYQVLRKNKFKGNIILHDYNGDIEITKKFLDLNTYFSLGQNFLRESSKVNNSFKLISNDRMFFETDSNVKLVDVYKKAETLKKDLNFKKDIFENFKQVFLT